MNNTHQITEIILKFLTAKYGVNFYKTKVVNGIAQHFESDGRHTDYQYTGYIGFKNGIFKLLSLKRLDLHNSRITETIIFEEN